MNKMVIIGIAVAALLIGGGGAAFYFMTQAPAEDVPEVDTRRLSIRAHASGGR